MGIPTSVERSCGRSMAVQAESNGRHGMRMSVAIEITGMAGLAIFAADCTYRTATERTVVQGIKIMTGVTGLGNMGFPCTRIRYSRCGVTVQTEGHGAHAVLGSSGSTMIMTIEISGMTGRTGIGRATDILIANGTAEHRSDRGDSVRMTGRTAVGAMDTVQD